ncbi:MAG: PEP-CTERM sorting domain-containing protein [Phycisphaerales bacterium]
MLTKTSTLYVLVSVAVCVGVEAQPSFIHLGDLPGSPFTYMLGLSDDGAAASGMSGGDVTVWTRASGMQAIEMLPDAAFGYGYGMSRDGTTFVGYDHAYSGRDRAFRWTAAEGAVQLASLPETVSSYAYNVNADGSVIVGSILAQSGRHAIRWSESGEPTILGVLPGYARGEAHGVSADGRVVVGRSISVTAAQRAFIWTDQTGIQDLCVLAGGDGQSRANAISGDGRVIVGYSDSAEGLRAVRWVDGGNPESLGVLSGFSTSVAADVTDDGTVVVGGLSEGDTRRAFYWSEALGMLDLNNYLPTLGVDLSGWVLTGVSNVSADGLTLLGLGEYEGNTHSWIATIPSPGAAGLMAIAGIAFTRRRR